MKNITALTISVLLILSMCLNVYSNNEVTEIDNTVTNIDNTEESDTIKLEETEGIDNVISSTDSKFLPTIPLLQMKKKQQKSNRKKIPNL